MIWHYRMGKDNEWKGHKRQNRKEKTWTRKYLLKKNNIFERIDKIGRYCKSGMEMGERKSRTLIAEQTFTLPTRLLTKHFYLRLQTESERESGVKQKPKVLCSQLLHTISRHNSFCNLLHFQAHLCSTSPCQKHYL